MPTKNPSSFGAHKKVKAKKNWMTMYKRIQAQYNSMKNAVETQIKMLANSMLCELNHYMRVRYSFLDQKIKEDIINYFHYMCKIEDVYRTVGNHCSEGIVATLHARLSCKNHQQEKGGSSHYFCWLLTLHFVYVDVDRIKFSNTIRSLFKAYSHCGDKEINYNDSVVTVCAHMINNHIRIG